MPRIHPSRSAAALLAAPLVLAVAACGTAREPAPVNGAPPKVIGGGGLEGSCDAKAAQEYVGQVLDEALGERIKTATAARGVRVIRPGMAVTMDYRADRLNIEIDDDNRIVKVHCG